MPKKGKKEAFKNADEVETKTDETITTKENPVQELIDRIESLVENLCYSSETDAEVQTFVGRATESATIEEVLRQTGNSPNAKVEQRSFDGFFERLTKIEDWFSDEEKANAAKYAALKDLMARNLRDLTVCRIGKIQLDIYVVGLPAENVLVGIKTKAVET